MAIILHYDWNKGTGFDKETETHSFSNQFRDCRLANAVSIFRPINHIVFNFSNHPNNLNQIHF